MDTSLKSTFLRGSAAAAPFVLVVGPFGLVFGVVGTEAGLDLAQVMGFSILVIAGAAQITALQLLQENAPTVIVVLTALAVNLRMAMYSASLAPYLGAAPLWKRAFAAYFLFDQPYAVSHPEFEKRPEMTVVQRLTFFFGAALPFTPVWYGATLLGALVGQTIPPELALDFAVPITFLAIVAPALRSLPHLAAAITSIVFALALAWVPFSLGLIIAALIAMGVGAGTELWLERRRP